MARRRNTYKRGDHFTRRAREEGFEARSVYKLQEIDKRFRLFKPGLRVVDLGCSPGSWSRWATQRVGHGGQVVGVDIAETSVPGLVFHHADIREIPASVLLDDLGGPADLVLSDMAPRTTGNRLGDHVAQIELVELAWSRAAEVLAPGGAFVVKIFEGEDAQAMVERIRGSFAKHKRVRPDAVRKVSREFFLVATGFQPP